MTLGSTFSGVHDFFSSGTWTVIRNLMLFFLAIFWLAIAYWVYKDARRRIEDPWLVAMAVILYAISNTDVKKFEDLKGSLSKAFNVGILDGQGSPSVVSAGVIRQEESQANNASASNLKSKLELQQQQGQFADVIEFITQRPDGVAITVSTTLAFLSGSAELTPEGVKGLKEVAETLRELPNDFRIEGHSDDLPPGSLRFPTNWELSAARAVTIVKELQKDGISPKKLTAAGFGDTHPLAPNNPPNPADIAKNRALNRRAEVVVLDPALTNAVGPALGPNITLGR